MVHKLVLLIFVLLATSQAFNLRKESFHSYSDVQECKISCWSIADRVLPGETLGFISGSDGGQFKFASSLFGASQCCSQNLTYSGYNIPNYANVTTLNIPDQMVILVNISDAVKDENQTRNYNVIINQQFERQALNISIPPQYLSANLTVAHELDIDLSECKGFNFDWMVEYNLVGQNVYTSQVLGIFQNITVQLYTNQTYTENQLQTMYWNYIQTNSLSSIDSIFPDSDVYRIATETSGGQSLYDFQNWPSFVQSLNVSSYVFTQRTISSTTPKFSDIDSFYLFDGYGKDMANCAHEQWNLKFNRTTGSYEY